MPRLPSLAGAAFALALVVTSHGNARANSHEEGGGEAASAQASASLTLPKGSLLLVVPVEVSLSSGAVAKPISVAPDVWYGVMDKLSVGVVHSAFGSTGFFAGAGDGICVTGEDSGCAKFYDNAGLDIRYGLLDGSFLLAADVGAFATSLDPLTLGAKLGVLGMYPAGPLSILFNPNIFVGLTERDGGNKEVISIPVTLAFGLGDKASLGVQAGILAPLDGFADAFFIPVSAGLRFIAMPKLTIDAAFSFPALYSKVGETDTDSRAITLAASIAL